MTGTPQRDAISRIALRCFERVRRALDDARSEDEGEWVPAADGKRPDSDRLHGPL
jgi:hypothetical protein